MIDSLKNEILSAFDLEQDGNQGQRQAVLERERDIVVTAGAGSGKTRTLVARYMSLLADGFDVRRIFAITFTEKAAREMRSRVRNTIDELLTHSKQESERERLNAWRDQMDAARVSTIHSLCAEILRTHPAEAGVDPKFEVLDEGLTAALRARCVEDVMYEIAENSKLSPVFSWMDTRALSQILGYLLERRLQATEALEGDIHPDEAIKGTLLGLVTLPGISDNINILQEAGFAALVDDAGDKLAEQIRDLIEVWNRAIEALKEGNIIKFSELLYLTRREKMGLRSGKKDSSYKEVVKILRDDYDEILSPICGGKSADNEPPDADTEKAFREALPLVASIFKLLKMKYENELEQLSALDFDDLEGRAASLLKNNPQIQEKWRSEIDALLVDEFQDTNQRQRDIVEALTGQAGRLFIVGDAKQSIYRFRQADVAVFRSIRESIREKGGLPIVLDTTYRAHAWLLAGMNDLLRGVMGDVEDPQRPYFEPFSAMKAFRDDYESHTKPPHIEFVIGRGEKTDDARVDTARALAFRLWELKREGQIREWDDVALLFRSANIFGFYEDAFESEQIPFVTVAGHGFYDRPEIRDVMNILYALADPTDDLAMAGLLRSPSFGLSDAALYQMRWKDDQPVHYWDTLQNNTDLLEEQDHMLAERTLKIMQSLLPMVDRIPVAELLKKLIDLTDYRAILAISDTKGGARLWRNIDKLVDDARASGKTNVRDFLEYMETINATGAREGEAPAEAQGSVRLMTIHKSKGLQFPIVVLADAGRTPMGGGEAVYLDPELGIAFKMENSPLVYRLVSMRDKAQSDAEEDRILYVALTRAKEKLIISGHVTGDEEKGWKAKGWLETLCGIAEIDLQGVVENAGEAQMSHMSNGGDLRAWVMRNDNKLTQEAGEEKTKPESPDDQKAIFAPLQAESELVAGTDRTDEEFEWHPRESADAIPGAIIGTMAHKAIALWKFPDDPDSDILLETIAFNEGLGEKKKRDTAIRKVRMLLERLKAHTLFAEIDQASERYHELPFSTMINGYPQIGYIDLVFKVETEWKLVDFKTDAITSKEQRKGLVEKYSKQVQRYTMVVEGFLGAKIRKAICFLDDHGEIGFQWY